MALAIYGLSVAVWGGAMPEDAVSSRSTGFTKPALLWASALSAHLRLAGDGPLRGPIGSLAASSERVWARKLTLPRVCDGTSPARSSWVPIRLPMTSAPGGGDVYRRHLDRLAVASPALLGAHLAREVEHDDGRHYLSSSSPGTP